MPRISNAASLDLVSVSASTIFNTGNLTTSPVKFPDASSFSPGVGIRRVQMTNRHATAYAAFVLTTLASPAFVATAGNAIGATEGINVGPGATYFVNYKSDLSLWFVASGGSTPFQALAYDVPA